MDANNKCYLRNENFILYGSIFAFVIPLLIMILMFILTVKSLRMQLIKLETLSINRKKGNQSTLTCKFEAIKNNIEKNSLNDSNIESKYSKSVCFIFEKEKISNTQVSSTQTDNLLNVKEEISKKNNKSITNHHNANKKLYMQNEIKAVKVLGVVFACFLVSWLPYCLINIGTAICSIYKLEIFDFKNFLNFLTYIGYVSSTFNPIIYTAFNKKFRQNFVEIVRCNIKK